MMGISRRVTPRDCRECLLGIGESPPEFPGHRGWGEVCEPSPEKNESPKFLEPRMAPPARRVRKQHSSTLAV